MVPIILLLLPNLSTTAAYSSVPFCLTSGVTWNSPLTGGFPTVTTPEECQLLCTDSSDCNTITWYDSQASPLPNYCQMFLSPDESEQVSCTDCVSGPESCVCSGLYTCSLDSDQLIELMFAIKTEFQCAELCSHSSDCEFYSWFTQQNHAFKEACALLKGCSERTSSDTCHSGPSYCNDKNILEDDYPLCFKIGATWQDETSKGVPNITSPYTCQELCYADQHCDSFSWFSSISQPHQNFCEFYPLDVSEPTAPCSACISGLAACTCSVSDYQTCDTSQDLVIDILQHIESEIKCQDICARREDCSWYTWYSEEGDRFQFTCILLDSCPNKTQCQGCYSGPDNCENTELMSLPPQCTDYKQLSSYTRNVISQRDDNLCSASYCCDVSGNSHAHSDWAGEAWYRFTGPAGTRIVEAPPVYHACGTIYGGYMVGGHPTVEEGEATRTVYFDKNGTSVNPRNITVFNCQNFFVYFLKDSPGNTYGYCSE